MASSANGLFDHLPYYLELALFSKPTTFGTDSMRVFVPKMVGEYGELGKSGFLRGSVTRD
jgi:hypothetical protein